MLDRLSLQDVDRIGAGSVKLDGQMVARAILGSGGVLSLYGEKVAARLKYVTEVAVKLWPSVIDYSNRNFEVDLSGPVVAIDIETHGR